MSFFNSQPSSDDGTSAPEDMDTSEQSNSYCENGSENDVKSEEAQQSLVGASGHLDSIVNAGSLPTHESDTVRQHDCFTTTSGANEYSGATNKSIPNQASSKDYSNSAADHSNFRSYSFPGNSKGSDKVDDLADLVEKSFSIKDQDNATGVSQETGNSKNQTFEEERGNRVRNNDGASTNFLDRVRRNSYGIAVERGTDCFATNKENSGEPNEHNQEFDDNNEAINVIGSMHGDCKVHGSHGRSDISMKEKRLQLSPTSQHEASKVRDPSRSQIIGKNANEEGNEHHTSDTTEQSNNPSENHAALKDNQSENIDVANDMDLESNEGQRNNDSLSYMEKQYARKLAEMKRSSQVEMKDVANPLDSNSGNGHSTLCTGDNGQSHDQRAEYSQKQLLGADKDDDKLQNMSEKLKTPSHTTDDVHNLENLRKQLNENMRIKSKKQKNDNYGLDNTKTLPLSLYGIDNMEQCHSLPSNLSETQNRLGGVNLQSQILAGSSSTADISSAGLNDKFKADLAHLRNKFKKSDEKETQIQMAPTSETTSNITKSAGSVTEEMDNRIEPSTTCYQERKQGGMFTASTTVNKALISNYGDNFIAILIEICDRNTVDIQGIDGDGDGLKLFSTFSALRQVKREIEDYIKLQEELKKNFSTRNKSNSVDDNKTNAADATHDQNQVSQENGKGMKGKQKSATGARPKAPGSAQPVPTPDDNSTMTPPPRRVRADENVKSRDLQNFDDREKNERDNKVREKKQINGKHQDQEWSSKWVLLKDLFNEGTSVDPSDMPQKMRPKNLKTGLDLDLHSYVEPHFRNELKNMGVKDFDLRHEVTKSKELQLQFKAITDGTLEYVIETYRGLLLKIFIIEVGIPTKYAGDLIKEIDEVKKSTQDMGISTYSIEKGFVTVYGFDETRITEAKIGILTRIGDYDAMIHGNAGSHNESRDAVTNQPKADKSYADAAANRGLMLEQAAAMVNAGFPANMAVYKPFCNDLLGMKYRIVFIGDNNTNLEFHTRSNIRVTVLSDSMVQPRFIKHVQVIACPTDETLGFRGGLSKIIGEKAGLWVIQDCQNYVKNLGPLKVANFYCSFPGLLGGSYNNLRNILHVVGPDPGALHILGYKKYGAADIFKLTSQTYYNCFKYVNDVLFLSAIALPPFGSGNYHVPIPLIVESAVDALRYIDEHRNKSRFFNLQHICFVTNQPEMTQEMVSEFLKYCDFKAK